MVTWRVCLCTLVSTSCCGLRFTIAAFYSLKGLRGVSFWFWHGPEGARMAPRGSQPTHTPPRRRTEENAEGSACTWLCSPHLRGCAWLWYQLLQQAQPLAALLLPRSDFKHQEVGEGYLQHQQVRLPYLLHQIKRSAKKRWCRQL